MKHRINAYKIIIGLAFVIIILLSGCNTRSNELNAILKSSVATTQLTTGREVSRSQQDKSTTLGKPVYAKLILEYEPVNNNTKEDVFNEIVAILEKDNWEREELSRPIPGFFKATLPQDNFSLVADVSIDAQRNTVIIRLETIPR
ncbi:MAG: hypothetical protein M3R24_19115 [Chloroflexota bacterium]|nr:hypothetical protein [Chloroflexota bacterium]